MRYVLIFVIIASVIMTLLLSDMFPGFLAHHPRLQEANWTVRELLGLDTPRSPRLSERHLKETDRMLRQESSAKKEVTEEDLGEYYE
jgi:hypothetical protein